MIRRMLGLAALAGLPVLVACGSDDAEERYPSAESFCTAKADEECKGAAAVCAATVEACNTKRRDACRGVARPATGQARTYRPGAAEGCLNLTRQLFEARTVDAVKEKAQAEACERVFTGSKKKNEPCSQPYECEGALVCDKGICAEKATKNTNDPCNNPGDVCATESYCAPRGETRLCLVKNDVGAVCSPFTPCKDTLRCSNGTCAAKAGSGETCVTGDDCATGFCDAAKRCAAKLVPGAGGCKDYGGP